MPVQIANGSTDDHIAFTPSGLRIAELMILIHSSSRTGSAQRMTSFGYLVRHNSHPARNVIANTHTPLFLARLILIRTQTLPAGGGRTTGPSDPGEVDGIRSKDYLFMELAGYLHRTHYQHQHHPHHISSKFVARNGARCNFPGEWLELFEQCVVASPFCTLALPHTNSPNPNFSPGKFGANLQRQ